MWHIEFHVEPGPWPMAGGGGGGEGQREQGRKEGIKWITRVQRRAGRGRTEKSWNLLVHVRCDMFVDGRMSLFVACIFLYTIVFRYNRDRISMYLQYLLHTADTVIRLALLLKAIYSELKEYISGRVPWELNPWPCEHHGVRVELEEHFYICTPFETQMQNL